MKLLDMAPHVGLHDWDIFLADRVAAVRAAQERELRDRIDEEGCGAVVAALRFGGPAGVSRHSTTVRPCTDERRAEMAAAEETRRRAAFIRAVAEHLTDLARKGDPEQVAMAERLLKEAGFVA